MTFLWKRVKVGALRKIFFGISVNGRALAAHDAGNSNRFPAVPYQQRIFRQLSLNASSVVIDLSFPARAT